MLKGIGYIRVSTEKQSKDGVSLENQRLSIESYCKYKGLELTEIISDEGISGGKNKSRQGFIEVLDRIEHDHDVKSVILYSLERLSRDMLTLLALERLLEEHDVQLHTIDGQINTSSPDGFMSFAMRAFLGEMERRQVKYRTKQAMKHKKKLGEVVGSVPYGYQRKDKELIPELSEQKVIKRVTDLYIDGNNLSQIARIMNGYGIKTRNGKDWTTMQIKRLIPDYQEKFKRTKTKISGAARIFIEAIA